MTISSTRLVIYSALFTIGIALMLLGITSLAFVGIALIVLAAFFSPQQRAGSRPLRGFIVCAVIAAVVLIRHLHRGDAFAQESLPLWFWVVLGVIWLWAILGEFQRWRKNRSVR